MPGAIMAEIEEIKAEMENKYQIIDASFDPNGYTGTYDEIVDAIISCNDSWQTDYSHEDFKLTGNGIMCRGDLIAVECE
jgi:hypothetical protein